jgi:hypothetical protein
MTKPSAAAPAQASERSGQNERSLLQFRRLQGAWIWGDIVIPFLASRFMLVLIVWLALYRGLASSAAPATMSPGIFGHHHFWLNMWAHWDAYLYLLIAQHGYRYDPAQQDYRVAFFPLYPLCIRAVSFVLGHSLERMAVAGVLVSNGALLAALTLLAALFRLDYDDRTAARAVLYLLVFPVTFFLSAIYSESLFLACVLGCFYCARTGRWWLAGLCGCLASLCRPPGVLLVIPIAWEYLAQRRYQWRAIRADILSLALIPAGLLAYALYLKARFGDFLLFMHVQVHWGRQGGSLFHTFWNGLVGPLGGPAGENHSILDTAFMVLYLILIFCAWRLKPRSYALFATLYFLTALGSGDIRSLMRFGMSFFVVFLVLALAGRRPEFDRVYMIVSTALAALFVIFFALGYWVA